MAKSFALYKNAEKLGNNLSRTQINQRYQKKHFVLNRVILV